MSEGPRSDWTILPQIVDGVADFVACLGQWHPDRPVYLLGESLGGPLIMQLAARHHNPSNLAGLVVASCELEPTHLTAKGGAKAA
jgi:alpha-beta hydrolase superfamily lysophospholipase